MMYFDLAILGLVVLAGFIFVALVRMWLAERRKAQLVRQLAKTSVFFQTRRKPHD